MRWERWVEECGSAAAAAVRGGGAWLACLWRALGWLWEIRVPFERHGKTPEIARRRQSCNEKRTSLSILQQDLKTRNKSARRERGVRRRKTTGHGPSTRAVGRGQTGGRACLGEYT